MNPQLCGCDSQGNVSNCMIHSVAGQRLLQGGIVAENITIGVRYRLEKTIREQAKEIRRLKDAINELVYRYRGRKKGETMNLQTEQYKVLPGGCIQSGNVAYTIDLDSGTITLTGTIVAQVLFFKKTVQINQPYQVPPADVLSSNLNKVGDTMVVGPATMTVTAIDLTSQIATVEFVDDQDSVTGHAAIDISQPAIKIVSATALAKAPVVGQLTVSLMRA